MKDAVIYPRYSSTGQNEQSIETQIQKCREYAQRNDLTVIAVYDGDKAKSASKETEKRTDLHRMFADAETGSFQYIIVYSMDRFARNITESRLFKSQLARVGVKVLSATEHISDDEGGELYEMFLEWNAEKYSQRLSKRVRDGLKTSYENGTFTGGHVLYGYKVEKTTITEKKSIKKLVIDEPRAEIVRYIFNEYANGRTKKQICAELNKKGARNFNGKPFTINNLQKNLVNKKYIGIVEHYDTIYDKTYPPIISREIFDKVQINLNKLKRAPASKKAKIDYVLSGSPCKLCGGIMVGVSGTSHTKGKHFYYACSNRYKFKTCTKQNAPKEKVEKFVVESTIRYALNPNNAKRIAESLVKAYSNNSILTKITDLENKIRATDRELDKCVDILMKMTSEEIIKRINVQAKELEIQKTEYKQELAKLKLVATQTYTVEDVLEFLSEFIQKGNETELEYRQRIIKGLVIQFSFTTTNYTSHMFYKVVRPRLTSNYLKSSRNSHNKPKPKKTPCLCA